jgi:prepilin peptidase CpaA
LAYIASHIVLVITASLLFYAALTDLKEYKIRNELILVLLGLFVLHAFLSGRWVYIHWNLGLAFLMLIIMMFFYSQRLMGGGDVKILAVAFLWVGLRCAFPFAILLLVFTTIHTIAAKFGWVHVRRIDNRKLIPFAPSVAAALIGTFMLGCLAPGPESLGLGTQFHR